MSLSENLQNQADDYLKDTLAINAKKAFELLLQENQELVDYIAINKEMQAHYTEEDWSFGDENHQDVGELEGYLKSDEAKALKASIKKVNDRFVKERPSNRKNYFSYLAIAATILVFVGYFVFNNSTSNLELYENYNSWQELPSLINRGDVDDTTLAEAENAFINKNYEKAHLFFDAYIQNSYTVPATVLLYQGVVFLELNEYNNALTTFNELIESNSLDNSKGYWYKVLVYLKMDDKVNAIKQLEIITSNPENFKFVEAQELLEKL
jgi:tetratricopeptide (TPR) repeat protein